MWFGILTNLLALTPTLYMLEVYGRVVNSRSGLTLAMLTLLVVAGYVWLEWLEWVRQNLLHRLGHQLEARLAPGLFDAIFQARLRSTRAGPAATLADLATLRAFVASSAVIALLDAPFALLVLLIIFAINPWLGLASLLAAWVLALIGWLTDRSTRQPMAEAHSAWLAAQSFAAHAMRQSQVIEAMGMLPSLHRLWQQRQQRFLLGQARASDRAGLGAAVSKFIQTLQASLLLGLGCWLTLLGSLDPTGAMMIVGSLLGGRAIAPITQLIGQWRQVAQARSAYARLDQFLGPVRAERAAMTLPAPHGLLSVEALSVLAPGTQTALLRGIQFTVKPGQILAVVGPSGAGKTTLTRLLVGLWSPASGKVRLDGVDLHAWDKTELGPHIGYLPQGVALFDGSLADNIARFGEPDSVKLQAAVQAAGLQDLVAALPQGLATPLGFEGAVLSGGMRQRVGMARALYGEPQLLVLDEPNASLDEAGEAAMLQTLAQLKQRGATVVLVTHRAQALALVDGLLILREGQMQACGSRDEVLAALKQARDSGAAA